MSMVELDLTEAIEAAARALATFHEDDIEEPEVCAWFPVKASYLTASRDGLAAAAPLIERQVREKIAQEILAAEPPQEETNPRYQATYGITYEHAAAIARGDVSDE